MLREGPYHPYFQWEQAGGLTLPGPFPNFNIFFFLIFVGQHFELITAKSANVKTHGEVGLEWRKALA